MNVIPLVTAPRESQEAAIATLEGFVELCEQVGMTGVAIAGVDRHGMCHTVFAPGENITTLLGACVHLEHNIFDFQTEISTGD